MRPIRITSIGILADDLIRAGFMARMHRGQALPRQRIQQPVKACGHGRLICYHPGYEHV